MNPEALDTELNDVLTTERRSLVHHLDEAKPYLTAETYRIWSDIERMIHTSHDHANRISALLEHFELPERPTSFSPQVARFHYVTVPSLLPQLIDEKQQQIEAYRRAVEHAGDEQDVCTELGALLKENEEQIAQLKAVAANLSAVVAG